MSNQRTGERNSAQRIYTGKQAQSTHARIDDWTNERTNERANQLSIERKEQTNERPNKRTSVQKNELKFKSKMTAFIPIVILLLGPQVSLVWVLQIEQVQAWV